MLIFIGWFSLFIGVLYLLESVPRIIEEEADSFILSKSFFLIFNFFNMHWHLECNFALGALIILHSIISLAIIYKGEDSPKKKRSSFLKEVLSIFIGVCCFIL